MDFTKIYPTFFLTNHTKEKIIKCLKKYIIFGANRTTTKFGLGLEYSLVWSKFGKKTFVLSENLNKKWERKITFKQEETHEHEARSDTWSINRAQLHYKKISPP